MWLDKQKMIKRILKLPPLYGSPYTRHNPITDAWEWNGNVLQDMSAKELERLMNVAQGL